VAEPALQRTDKRQVAHNNNEARQATIHPPRLSFSSTGAAIMLPA